MTDKPDEKLLRDEDRADDDDVTEQLPDPPRDEDPSAFEPGAEASADGADLGEED